MTTVTSGPAGGGRPIERVHEPRRTNYWETVPSNYLELALWMESDRMGFCFPP